MTETLTAYRWQPYVEQIAVEGVDLSAASVSLQVRAYPDAPGDPLIYLTRNDDTAAQGIAVRDVQVVDGIPTGTLQIRVNETTLEGLLPFPASGIEPGQSLTLAYDLVLDVPGVSKARWLTGAFVLVPGANQA